LPGCQVPFSSLHSGNAQISSLTMHVTT
jgi:hypothetical protein